MLLYIEYSRRSLPPSERKWDKGSKDKGLHGIVMIHAKLWTPAYSCAQLQTPALNSGLQTHLHLLLSLLMSFVSYDPFYELLTHFNALLSYICEIMLWLGIIRGIPLPFTGYDFMDLVLAHVGLGI